ncbi:MAG: glycosyltransferase family 2 protein [Anaerolineae bacterium]|nr:MAG: glycosyltransferase family 2 protein [Anaerolineae bacterium]
MPRITFGIISLNGLPFLEYNLRALYSFAHQIIVVEGAVETARGLARPDGHSQDGTYEFLQRFRAEDDPDKKLVLISAADAGYADGFWPEKDEMSQAYATRARGDWLWQVDGDEFYRAEDMQAVCDLLDAQPDITAASFPYREFWGAFDCRVRGWWHDFEHPAFHRLFRWRPGYTYATHRPPTVRDEQGRDLRTVNWLGPAEMKARGVWLYHYSYVLPKQAEQKVGYYSHVTWTEQFRENARWLEYKYYGLKDPLFISELGRWKWQWLERYSGPHPQAIQQMQADLASGALAEPQRRRDDLERLLRSPLYGLGRLAARAALFLTWHGRRAVKPFTRRLRALLGGD